MLINFWLFRLLSNCIPLIVYNCKSDIMVVAISMLKFNLYVKIIRVYYQFIRKLHYICIDFIP